MDTREEEDKIEIESFDIPEALGETRLEKIRSIVEKRSVMTVEGQPVDLFSASIFLQVYDALNIGNKEKILKFPLLKMFKITFQLANGHRERNR